MAEFILMMLFLTLGVVMGNLGGTDKGVSSVLQAKGGLYCKSAKIEEKEVKRCWIVNEITAKEGD